GSRDLQPSDRVAHDGAEPRAPHFALDRNALCDWRALGQHAAKRQVAPARRKVDEIVLVEIGIDEPGQSQEREIVTIDRMGDQQRIAGRRFDRPEIVELDHDGIVPEEWRAGHLRTVVKVERRTRIARDRAVRELEVPCERAVLDLDVSHEWNQKAAGHRIDERWTLLDREQLRLQYAADHRPW